jgi:hypothetical protein
MSKTNPSDYGILQVRKLADKTRGERKPRWDPDTGEKFLVNPATGLDEPWPTLGWEPYGELPKRTALAASTADAWASEGLLEFDTGDRPMGGIVMRPGGPEHDPWRVDKDKGIPHTFRHCDAITLRFLSGPVRYLVTENPDKWHDGPEGEDRAGDLGADVRNRYLLELEG